MLISAYRDWNVQILINFIIRCVEHTSLLYKYLQKCKTHNGKYTFRKGPSYISSLGNQQNKTIFFTKPKTPLRKMLSWEWCSYIKRDEWKEDQTENNNMKLTGGKLGSYIRAVHALVVGKEVFHHSNFPIVKIGEISNCKNDRMTKNRPTGSRLILPVRTFPRDCDNKHLSYK